MAGKSVPQLAIEFSLCQATVRSYIVAYNTGGIDALRPGLAPGRPPKIGQLSREDWSEILSQTPDQYDRLETDDRQWSLSLLVRYAKE
jgi:transposase